VYFLYCMFGLMVFSMLQNVKASLILLLLILCLFDGVLINHDNVYVCVNCTEFTTTGCN
jgi:hypothetical protein